MNSLIDIGGTPTWYGDHGDGAPLVLFHPGLVDARALHPHPHDALAGPFRVYTRVERSRGRTSTDAHHAR